MVSVKSKIIGCGSYAPGKVVTNRDLQKIVDTTDEWITTRTGIKERRIAAGEKTFDIASKAAKEALCNSLLSAKDIDLVITGTVTNDMIFPSCSCMVQQILGLKPGIPAFDVSAACSGFLYALDVADKYIKSGTSKNALVIGVDVFSRIIDWQDRGTCVLFGDAAGAVIISQSSGKSGILSTHLHSDGRYRELLYAPSSVPDNPFEKNPPLKPYVKMKGNEIFKLAVKNMINSAREVLEANNLMPEDIKLLIPHQANIRIIAAMKERLKLKDEQVFSNIERFGNTSSASIPVALDEAIKAQRIKKGDIVLFVAFGGGLTWAATVVRW